MKKYIALLLFVSSFSAQAASGCLVRAGKKMQLDPKCKCLETKTCAAPEKLKYSKKFFEAKKPNNTPLFSEKEKVAYEKSYKLFNQIMELKAKGQGDSEEIKKLYFELDKTNSEISVLLHKNHPEVMKDFKKRYEVKSKARQEKRKKTDLAIKEFLASNGTKTMAKTSTEPFPTKPAAEPAKAKTPAPEKASSVVTTPVAESSVETEGLSAEDKKEILRKLNKEKLEVTEEDSLFEIISKTYKGKAYKKLWAPKDIEEKSNEQKAP